MRLRPRGKLELIAGLTAELARSREREGVLRERLDWYRVAVEGGMTPLRSVPGCGPDQAPLSAALRTSR